MLKQQQFIFSSQMEIFHNKLMNCLTRGTPWYGEGQLYQRQLTYVRTELLSEITKCALDSTIAKVPLSEKLANSGFLPMFGFPTRTRELFTKIPRDARNWPPKHDIIDRELDIAISQFAPGSEIIKYKLVHTACGVAQFILLGPEK